MSAAPTFWKPAAVRGRMRFCGDCIKAIQSVYTIHRFPENLLKCNYLYDIIKLPIVTSSGNAHSDNGKDPFG